MWRRAWIRTREIIGRYFVAGILAFAPILITIWAIAWIIQKLDNLLLPTVLQWLLPGLEDPPRLPFVGAVFTILVILLFGVIARHFFGFELVRLSERFLTRVPIARSIYGAVKQLLEAIFVSSAPTGFRRVVMIEYPRPGLYALAFSTGPARGPVQGAVDEPLVSCFVPTTPNPTSGFYLLVPEREVRVVDMSVEDGFKVIMSAGLVAPGPQDASEEPSASEERVAPPERPAFEPH